MKKFLLKINLICILVCLIVSAFSCKNDANEEDEFYININVSADTRTILPECSIEELTDFSLVFENEVLKTWENLTALIADPVVKINCNFGIIELTLSAKQDNLIYSDTKKVITDNNGSISFNLSLVNSATGNGSFEITLKAPYEGENIYHFYDCFLLNTVSAYIECTVGQPVFENGEIKVTISNNDLKTGLYTFYFVSSVNTNKYLNLYEIVKIAPGVKTKKVIDCKLTDFKFPIPRSKVVFYNGNTKLGENYTRPSSGNTTYLSIEYELEDNKYVFKEDEEAVQVLFEIEKPEGYIFEGWYYDPELTNKMDGYSLPTGETINLYAKFIEVVKVTFDPGEGYSGKIDPVYIPKGKKCYIFYDYDKKEYFFEGINDDKPYNQSEKIKNLYKFEESNAYSFSHFNYSDGVSEGIFPDTYSDAISINKDITIKGVWIKKVKVSIAGYPDNFVMIPSNKECFIVFEALSNKNETEIFVKMVNGHNSSSSLPLLVVNTEEKFLEGLYLDSNFETKVKELYDTSLYNINDGKYFTEDTVLYPKFIDGIPVTIHSADNVTFYVPSGSSISFSQNSYSQSPFNVLLDSERIIYSYKNDNYVCKDVYLEESHENLIKEYSNITESKDFYVDYKELVAINIIKKDNESIEILVESGQKYFFEVGAIINYSRIRIIVQNEEKSWSDSKYINFSDSVKRCEFYTDPEFTNKLPVGEENPVEINDNYNIYLDYNYR